MHQFMNNRDVKFFRNLLSEGLTADFPALLFFWIFLGIEKVFTPCPLENFAYKFLDERKKLEFTCRPNTYRMHPHNTTAYYRHNTITHPTSA